MTVQDNLALGAYLESDAALIRSQFAKVYEIFPRLKERAAQLAGTMSGGEQAMVSIGRGLMAAPKLLVIDEPSLGLSPLFVKENFRVIQQINAAGHDGVAGRAERAPDAGDRPSWLCADPGPRDRPGFGRGAVEQRRGSLCVFRLRINR